jgi:hypothetical protein
MLLLWVQRNLHVGPGTALAQVGYFPIQPVEPTDTVGKSKTCALKWVQSNRAKGVCQARLNFPVLLSGNAVTAYLLRQRKDEHARQ